MRLSRRAARFRQWYRAIQAIFLLSILASCGDDLAFRSPITYDSGARFYGAATYETVDIRPAIEPAEFDREYVGLRFDPSNLCRATPAMPRTAPAPLTPHSQIRARAKPLTTYGNQAQWRIGALSPGDLLEVRIVDGEMFSGSYVVGADGAITLPHLPPIMAAGRSLDEVTRRIERELVDNGLFRAHAARVDVVVRQYGEVSISVGGRGFLARPREHRRTQRGQPRRDLRSRNWRE